MSGGLYDELGIAPTANDAEILAAGRARAKQTHPDAGGSPEAFDRVQKALQVLRDPTRRAKYDRTGDTEKDGGEDWETQQAHGILANFMREVVRGSMTPQGRRMLDLKTENAQDLVAKAIATLIGNLETERNQLKAHRERALLAQTRFNRKKKAVGEQDVIADMLAFEVRDCDEMMVQAEIKIRVHQKAAAIISGYGYKVDPTPEQTAYNQAATWRAISF